MTAYYTELPDHTLKSLAEMVGPLPDGDVPVAWYLSTHPEVLSAYERWRVAHQAWRDRVAELCEKSGFEFSSVRISTFGDDTIAGFYVPDLKEHPWWRRDKAGYWVPRKRTKAEKSSEVYQRFAAVRRIPSALKYVPGMPHSLWLPTPDGGSVVYPVKVRRAKKGSGTAVLAFLGADPDLAVNPPFEVSEHWSRMKLSIYHLLKEREKAAEAAVRPPQRYEIGVKS